MPTIYYIRHGKTEWNALGRFQGSKTFRSMISAAPRRRKPGTFWASCLRARIAIPSGLGFVTSPLVRARGTMELMRGVLSLPLHDYSIDDRLHEVGYGHWEGLTLRR